MGTKTGNPPWQDLPSTATPITAARLEAIENAIDAFTEPFGALVHRGAASGDVVLGEDQVHTPPAETDTRFEAIKSITNPDRTFMGAVSGYAVYFGTEQPGAGSIQGGACEAYSLMSGTINEAVLGWEGVGAVSGSGSYQEVIGLASTALAGGTTAVNNLIGFQARGPLGHDTPSIANAFSIKVLEPTVGTQQYSLYVTGRTTLAKGNHSSVLDIHGNSFTKRWSVGGDGEFTGYASDGSSVRTVMQADESTTGKFFSNAFSGDTKHAAYLWQNDLRLWVAAEGFLTFGDAMRQSTVGSAGGASVLPATPTTYIKIKTATGTTLVIPAYQA